MTVVITGLGAVTPLGLNVPTLWDAVRAGASAAQSWPDLESEGYRVTVAYRIPTLEAPPGRRGDTLAQRAAEEALTQATLQSHDRIGIYVGTTLGESERFETAAAGSLPAGQPPLPALEDAVASHYPRALRAALQLTGPARAYGTACAAGNYAIGAAAAAVAAGHVDVALAGGVEPFSRIALVGFSRSRAMSDERCRPFDSERRGMQLGEAAAFLVLERAESARARGATPLATVAALGLSCDAYHPVAPRDDGSGMAAAMTDALTRAALDPADIGLICAHGSGTSSSDAAEARAISHLFPHRPAVFATKGGLGHSMGAATAVEAVLTVLALRHQVAPPTANLRTLDPACSIAVAPTPTHLSAAVYALNCGFAFGGLNSALLLKRIP